MAIFIFVLLYQNYISGVYTIMIIKTKIEVLKQSQNFSQGDTYDHNKIHIKPTLGMYFTNL